VSRVTHSARPQRVFDHTVALTSGAAFSTYFGPLHEIRARLRLVWRMRAPMASCLRFRRYRTVSARRGGIALTHPNSVGVEFDNWFK